MERRRHQLEISNWKVGEVGGWTTFCEANFIFKQQIQPWLYPESVMRRKSPDLDMYSPFLALSSQRRRCRDPLCTSWCVSGTSSWSAKSFVLRETWPPFRYTKKHLV
ncbi:hypothetical protein GE061_012959 [Apolygus lucorum]|uniref:Uncharacterized protein n=1 Tax=Apolygus lucorum TaxID=248454 RepID=A0A6A4K2E5_APOLU|nr:hypothetical protein GE061_012959 [Apolygus lucorum]